jgi:hypothetical protein
LAAYDLLNFLQNYGFFEYVVPFLISYLIVFAILEKTGVFGKSKTTMNMVLAVLLAFTVVANDNILRFMNQYLSNITVGLIFLSVAVLVFMSILDVKNRALQFFAIIFAIATVLWALFETEYFYNSSGSGVFFGGFQQFLLYIKPFMQELFIFLAIALVLAIPILRGSRNKPPGQPGGG